MSDNNKSVRLKELNVAENFSAQKLTSSRQWKDLRVAKQTQQDLLEIQSRLLSGDAVLQNSDLTSTASRGYRVIFHGPSGCGKTLAAALLGKEGENAVYRIDLSKIVSKFIGETEKKLARLFDSAQDHGWILFFDETDALFGKRSEVQSSNDRHANQEVSYLLQRIESYQGLVILSSNDKSNIDSAVLRRFHSIIQFR